MRGWVHWSPWYITEIVSGKTLKNIQSSYQLDDKSIPVWNASKAGSINNGTISIRNMVFLPLVV